MIKAYKMGFTHGGIFHADEVLATALLRMIDPSFYIERQKDRNYEVPNKEDILVFDIGLGKYDHHQENALFRENGKKYSSVGLILKDFWREIGLTEKEFKYLDKTIIQKVDESDNYGTLCDFCSIISSFNTSWNVSKDLNVEELYNLQNKNFEEAVDLAKDIIHISLSKFREDRKNNSINYIQEIYKMAFMNLIDKKYQKNNMSFYDLVFFNVDNILSKEASLGFLDFANRIQNLINRHNYNAGFIYMINCFKLGNELERKRAIKFTLNFLKREINKSYNEFLAGNLLEDLLLKSKENFIVLDYSLPWMRKVVNYNETYDRIDFVISKNENNTYNIRSVPKSFYLKNVNRISFPEEIRGKEIDILTNYSKGLTFCHSQGFMCVTNTLEDAISLVKKVSN